jgi:predicted Rossmann-fold nucleotide-binding protein
LLYLKQYDGKVCLLNYNGFYEPLLALMRHYVDQKMMSEETMDRLIVADTPEELLLKL